MISTEQSHVEETELGVGVHIVSSLEQWKRTALSGCV